MTMERLQTGQDSLIEILKRNGMIVLSIGFINLEMRDK